LNRAGTGLNGSINTPIWVDQSAPAGQVGVAYSYQFNALGATSYTLFSGTLPTGLTLSSSGLLSGTPTTTVGSPFAFVVRATNSFGNTNSTGQSVTINATGGSVQAPGTPEVFVSSPSAGQIRIDIVPALDVGDSALVSYNFYIGTTQFAQNPDSKSADFVETNLSNKFHIFTGLVTGTTYYVGGSCSNSATQPSAGAPELTQVCS